MFKSKIKVILTIYEDVKFDKPPSWIFFQRGYPMILDRNFKRLQSLYMVKLDLKMMFGDVLK